MRPVQDTDAEAPCDVTIVAHDIGPVGGMERVLSELVLGLRKLGHHVTVLARTCELPPDPGIDFKRVRGPARPLLVAHPWFMLAGSLALRRWRRGVVEATGAIVLNRVDVISIHYCHQVGPTHPSRSSLLFRINASAAALLGRFAEQVCFRVGRPRRFVCVSEGVADEMREHFPRFADRIQTIHNGVDTEKFAPGQRIEESAELRARLGIAAGRLVAAFVGGEWGRKGLHPVVEAIASAREWDLVVAGAGDRQRYQGLADSLDVGRAVHWLGVSRDIAVVYALADVFVFPSSYEAFPLVALEAAACGLPILATPVSGVRELLDDGQSGMLIAREPASIAARLRELAEDAPLRRRIGEGARRAALRYTWTAMAHKHHELFARLAADDDSSS